MPSFHCFALRSLKKRSPVEPNSPIVYEDTIRGKDGERVTRRWELYPGRYGFGGATTHALLFDLLQLYWEQGLMGSQVRFGSIRNILARRGIHQPSKRDYTRIYRDFDILRGYDIKAHNAFWDKKVGKYVRMDWGLFANVYYWKPSPDIRQQEFAFGFVELNPVLQEAAKSRGFFPVGFPPAIFHQLKPLEQRLAIYLAKRFLTERVHIRFVEDLAHALPIQAARSNNVRRILKSAAEGLMAKKIPLLRGFELKKT